MTVEEVPEGEDWEYLLYTEGVAEVLGVKVGSFRRMRMRVGYAPEPDGYDGRRPWWWESTIDAWNETRPSRGKWKVRYGVARVDKSAV